jgi:hypothetical protein
MEALPSSVLSIKFCNFVISSLTARLFLMCPTAWLSGSGGTGETPSRIVTFLANRLSRERRSRCPLEPLLGGLSLQLQNQY